MHKVRFGLDFRSVDWISGQLGGIYHRLTDGDGRFAHRVRRKRLCDSPLHQLEGCGSAVCRVQMATKT